MISIDLYTEEKKAEWNTFIRNAKNGLFLFDRNYMDYHQSRFRDHSLMAYNNKRLIACIPAHCEHGLLISHAGLTFGGVISDPSMRTTTMLEIFEALVLHACEGGIEVVRYKCVPYIYQTLPSGEDLYALFIHEANLYRRDLSSAIYMPELKKPERDRVRRLRKATRSGLTVKEDRNYREYWLILEDNLWKRHKVKPVHSLEEIIWLSSQFPENIRLFSCYDREDLVAGVIVYESRNVAHIQYSACSERGRDLSALDFVYDSLIHRVFVGKRYFDFGISTEQEGKHLNHNLTNFKESYGAGAFVHDIYEMNIK
jgi:hypothetical protein